MRASFLRHVLSTSHPATGDSQVRHLRLRGARITGPLDLEAEEISKDVAIQDCFFHEAIGLRRATAGAIDLSGCRFPGLVAAQLTVHGNLLLDKVVAGSVDVRGAKVGGVLSLDDAQLRNPGGATLRGGGLIVAQGMSCSGRFISVGTIWLYGARISGGLSFTGASLRNSRGLTIDAQGMWVGEYLFLGSSLSDRGGFRSRGTLRLVNVRVEGFMCCWNAEITAQISAVKAPSR